MDRKAITIYTLLFLLAAGIVVFIVHKSNQASKGTGLAVELCFNRTQEATEDAPYTVQEAIKLSIMENGTVTGIKTGTQAGPDMMNGYTGTLSGELKDGTMELVYDYIVEGSQNKELETYAFGADGSLRKSHWPLIEGSGMLVPDKSGTLTIVEYKTMPCTVEATALQP